MQLVTTAHSVQGRAPQLAWMGRAILWNKRVAKCIYMSSMTGNCHKSEILRLTKLWITLHVDFGNYRISALHETLQLCFNDSFRVQQQQFLSVCLKLQHMRPSLDGNNRSSVQYIPRNIRHLRDQAQRSRVLAPEKGQCFTPKVALFWNVFNYFNRNWVTRKKTWIYSPHRCKKIKSFTIGHFQGTSRSITSPNEPLTMPYMHVFNSIVISVSLFLLVF